MSQVLSLCHCTLPSTLSVLPTFFLFSYCFVHISSSFSPNLIFLPSPVCHSRSHTAFKSIEPNVIASTLQFTMTKEHSNIGRVHPSTGTANQSSGDGRRGRRGQTQGRAHQGNQSACPLQDQTVSSSVTATTATGIFTSIWAIPPTTQRAKIVRRLLIHESLLHLTALGQLLFPPALAFQIADGPRNLSTIIDRKFPSPLLILLRIVHAFNWLRPNSPPTQRIAKMMNAAHRALAYQQFPMTSQ